MKESCVQGNTVKRDERELCAREIPLREMRENCVQGNTVKRDERELCARKYR